MSIETDKLNELLATYRAWKRLITIKREAEIQGDNTRTSLHNLCGQALRGRVLVEHEDLLNFYPHTFFYIEDGRLRVTSRPDIRWVKEGRVYYDEASALAMLPESNGRRADVSYIPTTPTQSELQNFINSPEDGTPYWITFNSPF